MDFSLSEDQRAIRDGVGSVVRAFGDDYWLARDEDGEFPREFHRAMAEAGWLGITMPPEYGGAGLGVVEAAIMMHEVANHGGGMAAASSVHINLFGPHPIVVFGTAEQKARWIPRLVQGQDQVAFGFTEPDAGLNTTAIKTFAQKVDGGYRVHGQKVWTSTAQVAGKIMLLTRTTKLEDCARPTDGITIFYTDLDRSKIDVHRIAKMGRKAVDSNALFIDGLFVPESDRIGEEGKGFSYILHSLNPERLLIGAEAVAIGQDALRRALEVRGRARGLRPADRPEPGHPAPAGCSLDGAGSRLGHGDERGLAVRPAPALRGRGQCRQVSGRTRRPRGLRAGSADARRLRLCQGVPRRALAARGDDHAHRAGQRTDDPVLHRREGAGPAQIVLNGRTTPQPLSKRSHCCRSR